MRRTRGRLDETEDYVRREIAAALARPELRVIPVLVEGAAVPAAELLPEELRALSRRHAVSLRDESWEPDVDRLAIAIRKVAGDGSERQIGKGAARRRAIRAHPLVWRRTWSGSSHPCGRDPANSRAWCRAERGDTSENVGLDGGGATVAELPAGGLMIALPRISEIELDEQIYSLVAGSVSPRRDSTMLRLRFRSFNESRSEKVLVLIAMRLVVGDALLLPATKRSARVRSGSSSRMGRYWLPRRAMTT